MRRGGRQGGRCLSSPLWWGWHAACFSIGIRLEGRCSSSFCTIAFGEARRMFPPRLRRGTRHPDAPLPPCFAAESVRVTTLRALPENTARHLGWPSVRVEGRCRPNVTSGCPKRSEGGCPCRNEDEHQPLHAPSHRNANTASEPVSCRSCPAAHSHEREPNVPRSAQPPASNQRQRQPQRCRCAPPARVRPNRQCR